ncbi:LysM peptidoglycan-binding and 3D domain-containing protein [Planomicrobium sp. CPCC 101110]|uniref:LysM peptidoglycan-binding and 3D domain-containing protein n=1 Tax=Planomicrobium sp. CPCC 101110 TaxID=2599619 RepID=UPI0011B59020|nr:3D domain-containing protein [Planomicrobium sp. CPCC 101110]TWT24742.1 LysM peptidoglycan-binding domain-containing protein [Planomicrobium sp. CPCC 101110]
MKKQIITFTAVAALSVGLASQASANSSYTVESGDTLWSISQKQNVSVDQLKGWNELSSDIIYPNQELQVEVKEQKEQQSAEKSLYIVQSGDTLFKIAQAHGISLDALMSWNGITGHWIYPGDKLVVKGGTPISVPKPVESAKAAPEKVEKASAPAKTEAVAKASAEPASGKEMTVSATAYTAFCAGCSGVTATGQDLRSNPNQKVIAVDPTVIPLGSRVWVEGYGEAIAGDTGGAIKGNKIDVFIPSQDAALNWGRKSVTIKILN